MEQLTKTYKAMKNLSMNCPKCGNRIKVDQLLISQFEESIRNDLNEELSIRETALEDQKEAFKTLLKQVQEEKDNLDELVRKKVKSDLQAREKELYKTIKQQINDEKSAQLQELEDELIKKSSQLKDLNKTKAKLERLGREFEERETKIILEKEQELTKRLEEAKKSIQNEQEQSHLMKSKEREKVIEDLKKQLEVARKRAEQGSMQLQGEVQELFLEEMLRDLYPYDEITEVKKGARGADTVQTVRTKTGIETGSIIYESKNTKSWSNSWIKKLKQDNLVAKADLMVIVTQALPEGIEKYGIIDDVWVCSLRDIKELSLVLRYGLLKVKQVAVTQQGKESKMELLYNYLTSSEFKGVFESIIEGFKTIQDSHQSEKLKMQRLWKQREKQLEQVLASSVEFYGSIKGIAGDSIQEIKMLDFFPQAS